MACVRRLSFESADSTQASEAQLPLIPGVLERDDDLNCLLYTSDAADE